MMDNLGNLVISFLDVEANKSLFCKEIAQKLDLESHQIYDVWLESEYLNGSVKQYLFVSFSEKIPKSKLMDLDFDYLDGYGALVFEVGDTIL